LKKKPAKFCSRNETSWTEEFRKKFVPEGKAMEQMMQKKKIVGLASKFCNVNMEGKKLQKIFIRKRRRRHRKIVSRNPPKICIRPQPIHRLKKMKMMAFASTECELGEPEIENLLQLPESWTYC
jgi:hypothetical protein